jgi:hypothetical protein
MRPGFSSYENEILLLLPWTFGSSAQAPWPIARVVQRMRDLMRQARQGVILRD